jgi:NADP-dependent 3-hydroxy acid dehydrogenase YdfG
VNAVRTAVVTGASSGVGAATALALARIGIRVALIARREERLRDVARQIEGAGGRADVIPADLSDAAAAERAMGEAVEALGQVDALINCLGTNVPGRALTELSIADWDMLLATNLSAVFYCVHAVLPAMRARRSGLIVSVSSLAGARPGTLSGAAYSAAKAGLNMFSGCINAEEGKHGIRSCVVMPGDIDTELLERRPHPPTPEERSRMLQPEDVASVLVAVIQQPERALVEEIYLRPSGRGT